MSAIKDEAPQPVSSAMTGLDLTGKVAIVTGATLLPTGSASAAPRHG